MFGVVQDRWMRRRVRITVVATGLAPAKAADREGLASQKTGAIEGESASAVPSSNGHVVGSVAPSLRLV